MMKDDQELTEEERISNGWKIVGCAAAIIVCHAVFILYGSITTFIKYVKDKLEERKKKKLVYPE